MNKSIVISLRSEMYDEFEMKMWRHLESHLDGKQRVELLHKIESQIWGQLMDQVNNKLRNRLYYG